MPAAQKITANITANSIGCCVALLVAGLPASAQYSGSQGTTSVRDPLIRGALSEPAQTPMPSGQAPAFGSNAYSSMPTQVTPGMKGLTPTAPAWSTGIPGQTLSPTNSEVNIPANNIDQSSSQFSLPMTQGQTESAEASRAMIVPYVSPSGYAANPGTLPTGQLRSQLTPYIPGPPSNPGSNKNNIPSDILPTQSGYNPPASVVQMGTTPGINGQASIVRWGGQKTDDFGSTQIQRSNSGAHKLGSQTTDLGQPLSTVAAGSGVTLSDSQDGPRAQAAFPGPINRSFPLSNVQEITDYFGTQTQFKNVPSQKIVAPF